MEELKQIQIAEPSIHTFTTNGRLIGTFEAMANRLKSLNMFEITYESKKLILINVESRDIKKNPYIFFIITFTDKSVNVEYSVAPDSSEKLRRLFIIKTLTGILSFVTDNYAIDNSEFYQQIDSSIDSILQSLSQSYSSLFSNYDAILDEYKEIKKLNIELMNSNKVLIAQSTKLTEEKDLFKEKLDKLEKYSDESLMVMVQDWIESHNNTIDIGEFSKDYILPQPRIEQIINKMVSLGYIKLKG